MNMMVTGSILIAPAGLKTMSFPNRFPIPASARSVRGRVPVDLAVV
jgi:hypothetical protein